MAAFCAGKARVKTHAAHAISPAAINVFITPLMEAKTGIHAKLFC